MSNDTRIAVDVAKAVFEIAISDRPGQVTRRERSFCLRITSVPTSVATRQTARTPKASWRRAATKISGPYP